MIVRRREKYYYTLNVECEIDGKREEGKALEILFIFLIT